MNDFDEALQQAKELGMVPIDSTKNDYLQRAIRDVRKSLTGYTYIDMEPLFEEVIAPLYLTSSRTPFKEPDYKIVDRKTGEEYTIEKAAQKLKKDGTLPK